MSVDFGEQSSPRPLGEADWLSLHLGQHPIFSPSEDSGSAPGLTASSTGRYSLLEIKGTDVILAVNRADGQAEIRIASLLEAKKAFSQGEPFSPEKLSYKTFNPAVPFSVNSIALNKTGKLLAVAGESELIVFMIPRSSWASTSSRQLGAKSVTIGKYYHNAGSERIAKVAWHPWAQGSASLLVLTAEGTLREYDLSQDHLEPAQSVSFLPGRHAAAEQVAPTKRRRTTRSPSQPLGVKGSPAFEFSKRKSRAETPLADRMSRLGLDGESSAETAVSFAFGSGVLQPPQPSSFENGSETSSFSSLHGGWEGWAPLELYGVMKNGDVYKICPFLPSKALLPTSYLRHLASYVNLQVAAATASGGSIGRQLDLALRFVRNLTQQAAAYTSEQKALAQGDTAPPSPTLERSRWNKSRAPSTPHGRSKSMMSLDTPAPDSSEDPDLDDASVAGLDGLPDSNVLVIPPNLPLSPKPKAIGPHLLQPAPAELSEEREPTACDIAVTRVEGTSVERSAAVVVITMDDGRLDICLDVSSRNAVWDIQKEGALPRKSTRSPYSKTARSSVKPGRFTLSDSEDSENDDWRDEGDLEEEDLITEDESLPTLLVYESVDLAVDPTAREQGLAPPSLVLDPIYPDTVYAHHSSGAFAISFLPWAPRLLDLLEQAQNDSAKGEEALQSFLHRQVHSDLVQLVTTSSDQQSGVSPALAGLCVLTDVYLSYGLLAVTMDLQPIGIDMDFRVGNEASKAADSKESAPLQDTNGKKGYVSLLSESGAFEIPEPLNSYRGLPSQPRITGHGQFGKGEVVVTPDSLRFLGKTTEKMREEIRAITRAGNVCQMRLDLQLKELARQVGKIADLKARSEADAAKGVQTDARFNAVEAKQVQLNKRVDALLQQLVVLQQPEISIYERKWFDELDRLAAEFGVEPQSGAEGAANRTPAMGHVQRRQPLPPRAGAVMRKIEQLTAQLDVIKPEWQAQKQRRKGSAEKGEAAMLGTAQLARISNALAQQSTLLLEAKTKAQELMAKAGHLQVP